VDVLKLMRTNKALDSLKVLMSSGMDLSIECTQAGADGFIMKPFMPEELIEKIKTMSVK
jgi:DNA-binding response OmpR family regulator